MKAESMVVDVTDKNGHVTQMVKYQGGELITWDSYVEQQMQLLDLFNLHGIYSQEHYEVIVADDNTKVLRKREYPLKCDPDDDNSRVVSQLQKTKSERFFGRGGKEEDRLEIENPSHNLEVGEVEAFSL